MIVVSDTTPLRYLTLLGHVDLLRQLFVDVHCPDAVLRECAHPQAPAALRAWVAVLPEWILVDEVAKIDKDLGFLDDGEAAALTLGRRLRADLLLIDEWKGRRYARALGFAVAGTLNILAQAGRRGWLDYDEEVERLLQETNFHVTDGVVRAAWRDASA